MTLSRLKWLILLAAAASLVAFVAAQRLVLPDRYVPWWAYAAFITAGLAAVWTFNEAIFGIIQVIQTRQLHQYRELLALHEAGLDIAAEVDLDVVLRRIANRAATLLGAERAGIVLTANGTVSRFVSSDPPLAPPHKEGHWGVLTQVPVSSTVAGPGALPGWHPPSGAVLLAPVVSRGGPIGTLYIARAPCTARFRSEDRETAERLATQVALAVQNARLHALTRELAIGEERGRIAREMHDSLAQVLGYVNTKAQATEELLRHGEVERSLQHIGQLGEAARDAYADVREGILGLRSASRHDGAMLDALREYADRWQEQSGVCVDLQVLGEERLDLLAPAAELQLLRIIQEALSNVRKHAHASRARVLIDARYAELDITVADDGAGFDLSASARSGFPRFGLAGMRERAESVGGTLRLESCPGEGTVVRVCLPMAHAAAAAST